MVALDASRQAVSPPARSTEQPAALPWHVQLAAGLQKNCAHFAGNLDRLRAAAAAALPHPQRQVPALGISTRASSAAPAASIGMHSAGSGGVGIAPPGVSKEEIGRATWIFLHTLAAQYPPQPSRQQQKDVRNLVDILTRMYPCGECAAHFKEVVREHPPLVASRQELELWMCEVHNVVNRSLGKPAFNCRMVGSRWTALDCGEDGQNACSLDLGARR